MVNVTEFNSLEDCAVTTVNLTEFNKRMVSNCDRPNGISYKIMQRTR
jgi:hypothetical protein